jgi:DHA2 family multidrug resistance protein
LDKGQQADWFAASWMRWFGVAGLVSFVGFIYWELTTPAPIVNLHVFQNRNFAVGVVLVTLLGGVLYGTTASLPLFMQTLLGYSALQSGMALSPRGIGAFIMSMLVGRIVAKVSNRVLMSIGFFFLAVSSLMLGRVNLSIDVKTVILPSVINGLAISLIFIPLTSTAMGLLDKRQIASATGLFNLMRNTGGGIGIAVITTMLSRSSQAHQAMMQYHMSGYEPAFRERMAQMDGVFTHIAGAADGHLMALRALYNTMLTQASLYSFVDNFRLFGLVCFACVPTVWLFRKVKAAKPAAGAH